MVSRPIIHTALTSNIDWKSVFPSYVAPLFSLHITHLSITSFLAILLFTFILFLVGYAYLLYLRFRNDLSQKSLILEIKPPSISLQSAFSTKQLFTILHSLSRGLTFAEKILKVKRRISYEIVSTREEGIRYLLYIPQEDVAIVKKNLLAYLPGISVHEVADYLIQDEGHEGNKSSITEFKLAKSYVLPLQDQEILGQYDPIAYLTGHMTKLDKNDLVALQVITTPVNYSLQGQIMEHIQKLNKRIGNRQEIESELYSGSLTNILKLVEVIFIGLFNITKGIASTIGNWTMDFALASQRPQYQYIKIQHDESEREYKEKGEELTPKQKEIQELVSKKIDQSLFETTIRLYIRSSSEINVDERRKGIVSSFSTFSNPKYQSLKVKNDLPFVRSLFSRFENLQIKYRLLSFSSNPILSISEISSIYHFPYTKTTQTEDLAKIKSIQLSAPLSLKKADANLDIQFAFNLHGESITPIGLTLEERRRHMYIIGATGTGKTTLLTHMVYQDMVNGKGLAVVDPHGDLSRQLLGIVPESRVQDVIYFNPYDIENPIGLNLLEQSQNLSPADRQREKDLIVSTIISIFHKLYPPRYMGPKMEHVLRNTILTALELENPTFMTIYLLLTNHTVRKEALTHVTDLLIQNFWKEEFERLTESQKVEMISPLTNKLGAFLTTALARNIIAQNKSTLDFEEVINKKKILICDLSKGKIGEDTSSFLGSLIIAKLQLAALKRVHIDEEARVDFFLYIDEFQNFATQSFGQVLSEARKYRLNAILVHQTISQIEDTNLLRVILANVGTIISFRTSNPSDEDMILPIFSPQVTPGDIANLESYTFYIKLQALKPQDTFTGVVEKFNHEEDASVRNNVIDLSRKKYGVPVSKIENVSLIIQTIKAKNIKAKKDSKDTVLQRRK